MRRVGVDTGGTFTDCVAAGDGGLQVVKVPSTPARPAEAVLQGLRELACPGAVVHGTTVGTNTLLERRGARTVLVTTRGFRDLLVIGRGDRPALYALAPRRSPPLIPARRRLEARERLGPRGEVVEPLTEAEVERLLGRIAALQPESIAVCLLHAYANGRHERRLGRALRSLGVPVTLSHRLVGEFREYERLTTTVVNAYLAPRVGRYLQDLARRLGPRPLRVVLSLGGSAPPGRAAREPVTTLLSGPAGGVLAAATVARSLGLPGAVSLDMGGTSTDVAAFLGAPPLRRAGRVAGLPLLLPMLDIHTIGAGGGSIAWLDPGGALQVGPASAGAHPGPAAYGRGGRQATVTDACVCLGRLPVERPLAGGLRLDGTAARKALGRLARRAGLSVSATARGILAVTVSHMARALRRVSLARGLDPRGLPLIAFGGAAGLVAAELAALLGLEHVILPCHAGVLSAWGLLCAPPAREAARTVLLPGPAASPLRVQRLFAPLASRVERELRREGVHGPLRLACLLDLRYRGQAHELTVPFTPRYREAFARLHAERYGYQRPWADMEVVTLRVRGEGTALPPSLGLPSLPVRPGRTVRGPAVLSLPTFTAWVPPGWRGRFDDAGHLHLRPETRRWMQRP